MAKRRPSGDGMVRKREDGRWEGRIVVGHKSNGDSIFRYISAPTQRELSAKLRQLTEAYKGVDLTEESNMSLSVWLDKWLDEYMAATLRPTTLNGYRRSLELHVNPISETKLSQKSLPPTCGRSTAPYKKAGGHIPEMDSPLAFPPEQSTAFIPHCITP